MEKNLELSTKYEHILSEFKEINEQSKEITRDYSEIAKLNAEIEDLHNQLNERDDYVQKINHNHNIDKENLASLIKENETLKKLIENNEELDLLKKTLSEKDLFLSKIKSYYDDYNSKLVKELASLNDRNKFLDSIYQASTKYNESLKTEISQLENLNNENKLKIAEYEKNEKVLNGTINNLENSLLKKNLDANFGTKTNEIVNELLKSIENLEIKEKNNKILINKYRHEFLSDLNNNNYEPKIDNSKLDCISDFYNEILFKAKDYLSDYIKNTNLQVSIIDKYSNSFLKDISLNDNNELDLKKRESSLSDLDFLYDRLVYIAREYITSIKFFEYDSYLTSMFTLLNLIIKTKKYNEDRYKLKKLNKRYNDEEEYDDDEFDKPEPFAAEYSITLDSWKDMNINSKFTFLIDFLESILEIFEN